MKLLNWSSVLCLSPHPDDIEFSMGGNILLNEDTNFHSVVFSTGSMNDPVTNESRWKECDSFWEGISNITQHFMAPLLETYSEEGWINILEEKFNLNEFDAIFLPPLLDTHYEHRFVNGIGMALTRKTPVSIIEYKSVSVLDSWVPNMIVAIQNHNALEKRDRLERFVSQKKLYFGPNYVNASHIHLNSLKKKIHPTEQYRIVTLYS